MDLDGDRNPYLTWTNCGPLVVVEGWNLGHLKIGKKGVIDGGVNLRVRAGSSCDRNVGSDK